MADVPAIAWSRVGQRALLFRFAEIADANALAWSLAFSAEMERQPPVGATDWIPAVTSILVEWDRALADPSGLAREVIRQLRQARLLEPAQFPLHHIPVRYDGADLETLASFHGLRPEDIASLHSAPEYRVYMLGFSPGFAYLGPLDARLHTPRRSVPRTRVEPGAVAIGGEHTAIYPIASPGGWNLIGSTEASLFNPGAKDRTAFLLKHGDRVRFQPLQG